MPRLIVTVSRLMNPLLGLIDDMNFHIRHELGQMHVPFDWQFAMVAVLWCALGLMLLRLMTGWLRLASLITLSVVLARLFDVLPTA